MGQQAFSSRDDRVLMHDRGKSKEQILNEVRVLRQRVAMLEGEQIEHQRTEDALRTAKEYAETLINSSLDMIIAVDADRRIMEFNRAAEQTFGYSKAEVTGQSVDMLYADPTEGVRIHTCTKKHCRFTGEITNRKKNGETFAAYLASSSLPKVDGRCRGVMGISRDISAQKALEQQRADFIAMLTHDIKNPLTAMLGCIDLLAEETAGSRSRDAENFLERLKGNALKIHSLISNYLDFAKVEAGSVVLHQAPQAVGNILRQISEQYGAIARQRHLTLTFDLASVLPPVLGDALALERIFANLVQNALKFTPQGGHITLSAYRRTQNEGEDLVVEVRDTGPGIAPEDLSSLFGKYQRTAALRHYEGTGLGLFIVKTLVEAHAGRVEVESHVGEGTCFRVILPVHPSLNAAS